MLTGIKKKVKETLKRVLKGKEEKRKFITCKNCKLVFNRKLSTKCFWKVTCPNCRTSELVRLEEIEPGEWALNCKKDSE